MRFLGAIWLVWAGCSGLKGSSGGGDADTADNGDTTQPTIDDTGRELDSGGGPLPVWWSLGAEIRITKGLPVAAESLLTVTLLDKALAPLCSARLSIKTLEAIKATPDPSISVWWWVTPGAGTGCEGEALPLSALLGLGVGTLHPDIQARLVVEGLDESKLLGAYTAPAGVDADAPLYVYGAAGTAAAWLGKGETPAADAPLPDGLWELRPLSTFAVAR